MRRHHILFPVTALIATLPLLLFGTSCGHDLGFHLQSWFDAANQIRHGMLLPHWAFSPAFNAGEPRFVFYPPLSWLFGALLTFVAPANLLPALYTFCILTAAGFSLHRLAREFVSEDAALLAASLYIVNPYMLFTTYERTAYAELMAAIWMPLLFLGALRRRPTIPGIALPVALLWLTNAPAAVMGCYTLVLLVAFRLVQRIYRQDAPLELLLTSIAGAALGLMLPAFYLLPAAYERRFVQIGMAVIPNMRIEDNFLFGHTGDVAHDLVLHQATIVSIAMLALAFGLSVWLLVRPRHSRSDSGLAPLLVLLTVLIAFLLDRHSLLLWHDVPELDFLQFSWRLLAVLSVVVVLALGLACAHLRVRAAVILPILFVLASGLTTLGIQDFRQGCDASDFPAAYAQAFAQHQGAPPTDEYTPIGADNDALHAANPAFWFASDSGALAPQPSAQAAGATAKSPSSLAGGGGPASPPPDFFFHATSAGYLILNLRDYPNWQITLDRPVSGNRFHPANIPRLLPRDDGLIAMRLYSAGDYRLHRQWITSTDQWIGYLLSACGVCLFLWVFRRRTEV